MMARMKTKGCKCTINGILITPEWLVENKGVRHSTAVHRIYEYKRGQITADTMLAVGKANWCKGKSKSTEEWRLLSDSPREGNDTRAGEWESKYIPDDGRVGSNRTGRPQGTPNLREEHAYNPGQFRLSL